MRFIDLRENFMKLDGDSLRYQNRGWEPFKREFLEGRVTDLRTGRDLQLHITEPKEG